MVRGRVASGVMVMVKAGGRRRTGFHALRELRGDIMKMDVV